MKIDFEYLNEVVNKLNEMCGASKDPFPEQDMHSIHFEPKNRKVSVHVTWELFRNLVDTESTIKGAASYSLHGGESEGCTPWMYWSVDFHGCQIVACLGMWDVKRMLKKLSLPDDFSDDIEYVFRTWQLCTGWNVAEEVDPDA